MGWYLPSRFGFTSFVMGLAMDGGEDASLTVCRG